MKKADFKNYKKEDLQKGNILPMYSNWKSQKDIIGYAQLNYKIDKPTYNWIEAQIGEGNINAPHCILFTFQRWNVTFVDPIKYDENISTEKRWKYRHQDGFNTNRNISYYLRTSSYDFS